MHDTATSPPWQPASPFVVMFIGGVLSTTLWARMHMMGRQEMKLIAEKLKGNGKYSN